MTDFTIILRSLTSRLFSTVTTVVTVGVAVGLMLVLLSMRDSGRQAFERGSGNMHMLVSRDASPTVAVLNGLFYANPPQNYLLWSEYERIASSQPFAWAIPTQQGDSYGGLPVLASTPEFFTDFQPNDGEPWTLTDGRFFDKPFEVVLGAEAASLTGLRVGDKVHLTHGIPQSRQLGDPNAPEPHIHRDFTYTVVGVLEPTGSAHDRALFTHLTSAWIIHAHDRRKQADPSVATTTEADLLPEDRKITGIYLRVATRPGQNASASLLPVFDALRRDPSITVAQPVQQIGALFRIVSSVDRVFIAIAAVVMVSSGVGIMLALYNSMEQRRRQIAVLRVLGCSRGRIFNLVLTESALIGLLGAALGIVLCLVGVRLVASVMKEMLGLVIRPALPPDLALYVVVGAVFLAALAGIVPAVMAYRTSVANNLRPIG